MLTKLLAALVLLIGLPVVCVARIDHSLTVVVTAFTVIVVLPVCCMLSVDAAGIIRSEMARDRQALIFAAVLSIPKIILGFALLLAGLILPFVLLNDVITDIRNGQPIFVHAISIVTAFFMLIIGYFYTLEGLGLRKRPDRPQPPIHPGKK